MVGIVHKQKDISRKEDKMQDLKVFNYGNSPIRTVNNSGETWWVLKDVCEVLEISRGSRISERLDVDEVGTFDVPHPQSATKQVTVKCVNESGLYNVILRSDKPQAKPFRKWVTSEVLPSIRKNGAYMTDDTLEKALTSPDFLIQLATTLKEEKEKNNQLEATVSVQQQLIGELKPKADYTDKILQNKGLVSITQIAKDYGMSGQAMNKLLHDLGIQYKCGNQWLLYGKHQALGYTHSKTIDITRTDGNKDVVMETKWTQKGRLFLYEFLKQENILPVIERG